jgi:hypothetical protein
MNGFNPLEGLKDWHIVIALILCVLGLILGAWKIIEIAIWCTKHIHIN